MLLPSHTRVFIEIYSIRLRPPQMWPLSRLHAWNTRKSGCREKQVLGRSFGQQGKVQRKKRWNSVSALQYWRWQEMQIGLWRIQRGDVPWKTLWHTDNLQCLARIRAQRQRGGPIVPYEGRSRKALDWRLPCLYDDLPGLPAADEKAWPQLHQEAQGGTRQPPVGRPGLHAGAERLPREARLARW